MKNFTLQIASVPDRECVVSEIWFGEDQVAEVSSEIPGAFVIEFYPRPGGGAWSFELEEFESILSKAKENLKRT